VNKSSTASTGEFKWFCWKYSIYVSVCPLENSTAICEYEIKCRIRQYADTQGG
jgi:hypothetical protein